MRLLAVFLAAALLFTGCLQSNPEPEASADDEPAPTVEPRHANTTYQGTISGAGTPVTSVNDGSSDTVQTIAVEANATKIYINVTISSDTPEAQARVGFFCSENDQGAISCEEERTTTDELSWSSTDVTDDFDIAFFWDQGAGDMEWTALVTQIVREPATANATGTE